MVGYEDSKARGNEDVLIIEFLRGPPQIDLVCWAGLYQRSIKNAHCPVKSYTKPIQNRSSDLSISNLKEGEHQRVYSSVEFEDAHFTG